eukprot:g4939.t1
MREYSLYPEHSATYLKHTSDSIDVRRKHLPLTLFSLPETGSILNVATHFYSYPSLTERENARNGAMNDPDWTAYLGKIKPCVATQKSTIFQELETGFEYGFWKEGNETEGVGIYELRKYQLQLGYDTVPQFLDHFLKGLPSKLKGTNHTTKLISLLNTEVGNINEVIEVWRHGSTDAMQESRIAARNATEWKYAITSIAKLALNFETTIYKPCLPFSPMK